MIQILLLFHILLGSLALVAGAVAMYVTKGTQQHILAGRVFYYSLMISVSLSLIIALLPHHYNPFLMAIGIFTLYLAYSGQRAMAYKNASQISFIPDKIAAYTMMATSLGMMAFPILWQHTINVILFTFGLIGIAFAVRDLSMFKHKQTLQKQYLSMHIGKMGGAYIAAVTALLVVNDVFPGIWEWFVPTFVGTIFIARAIQKTKETNA